MIFSASPFLLGDMEFEGERMLKLFSESTWMLVSKSRRLFLRAVRFAGFRFDRVDFADGD